MAWGTLAQIAAVFLAVRALVYVFLAITDYSGLRCSLYLLFDGQLGAFLFSVLRLPFVWAGFAKRTNCDQGYGEIVTWQELYSSIEDQWKNRVSAMEELGRELPKAVAEAVNNNLNPMGIEIDPGSDDNWLGCVAGLGCI